ncbi:MAG: TolC family protein [Bradymonadia bacterium]
MITSWCLVALLGAPPVGDVPAADVSPADALTTSKPAGKESSDKTPSREVPSKDNLPRVDKLPRPSSLDVFEEDLLAVESGTLTSGEALTLNQVMGTVDDHHPMLRAAQGKIDEAEGKRFSAEGGFDLKLKAGQKLIPFGKDEYGHTEAMVEQPTTLWGTTFFGGYRRSSGEVPAYAGDLETVGAGEAVVGAKIPLWQGGAIDRQRADLQQTGLGIRIAELSRQKMQLKLYGGAAEAYWKWVAAGHVLRIRQHLLEVAQLRMKQIEDRVARGDLPEIDRIDNQRSILKRESSRVKATRKLQEAALKLSLYVRDGDGRPRQPLLKSLPPKIPMAPDLPATEVGGDVEAAQRRRPEPAQIELARDQLQIEVDLADNQTAPQIDFTVAGIEPLEEDKKFKTELEAGVKFTMPLQRRKARGKRAAAQAAKTQLEAESTFLNERIAVEVADARSALEAAAQQVEVARQELKVSRLVEDAEHTRLDLGASTLLVVNLREQATADAAERFVQALAEQHIAYARWRLAQGVWVPEPRQ